MSGNKEKTSQNVPKFKWTEMSEIAAQLLAEDKLTDEEIAVKCNITRRQLTRWKAHPEFAAKVQENVKCHGKTAQRYAIARKARRLKRLNESWEKLQQVIEERSADEEMQDVPGGKTGLLVHQVKGVGKGDDFQLIDEYKVDTGLLRELREHEKQAAQEIGEWSEKKELTGAGGGPIKVKGYAIFSPDDWDDADS